MLVDTERKLCRSDARRTPPSASEHILCELEHGLHWGSCKTVQGSTLRAREVLVAPSMRESGGKRGVSRLRGSDSRHFCPSDPWRPRTLTKANSPPQPPAQPNLVHMHPASSSSQHHGHHRCCPQAVSKRSTICVLTLIRIWQCQHQPRPGPIPMRGLQA